MQRRSFFQSAVAWICIPFVAKSDPIPPDNQVAEIDIAECFREAMQRVRDRSMKYMSDKQELEKLQKTFTYVDHNSKTIHKWDRRDLA